MEEYNAVFVQLVTTNVRQVGVCEVANFNPDIVSSINNDPDNLLENVPIEVDRRKIVNIKKMYNGVKENIYVCWSKELETYIGTPLEEIDKLRNQLSVANSRLNNLIDNKIEMEEIIDRKNMTISNFKFTYSGNWWKRLKYLFSGN